MQRNEMLPLVNELGDVTGCELRSVCHGPARLLHPVVHLHVVDSNGRVLLQLRSATKKIQPGKWDTAVGGHVDYGETVLEALVREASEEIGLDSFKAVKVESYVFESDVERELVYVFETHVPDDFIPVREVCDIDDLRFFSLEEIRRMIADGSVTPNFASEFYKYLDK